MLVVSLLNRTDIITEQLVLPIGSRARKIVEDAREGLIAVLRKRWMQIRQEDGFALMDERHLQTVGESESEYLTISLVQRPLIPSVPKRYT